MEIREEVALAPYTTFGVGGPARWFAKAVSEEETAEAVEWAKLRGVPLFVLGGGSNVLVSDAGFPGLVLWVTMRGIASFEDGASRVYSVAAGEIWDGLVTLAVEDGCAGIECLAGIPGTVGGTPVQNVGAYGQEVAETIVGVRVLDRETLGFREMSREECGFAYRRSVFNSIEAGRYLVTRVEYRLRPGGAAALRYADVRKAFSEGAEPALTEVAEAVRRIRRGKGMLIEEGDPDCRSAGSFFKNPVVSRAQWDDLTVGLGFEPPQYPAGEGWVKVPAAWLIEQAGFKKGFVAEGLERVGISSRHTLALINRGGATAAELMALRERVVAGVRSKFGIELEMEPILVGF